MCCSIITSIPYYSLELAISVYYIPQGCSLHGIDDIDYGFCLQLRGNKCQLLISTVYNVSGGTCCCCNTCCTISAYPKALLHGCMFLRQWTTVTLLTICDMPNQNI